MARDLCTGQAKLMPTSTGNGHSGLAHDAASVPQLQFFGTDLTPLAFFPDNIGYRAAVSPVFQLPCQVSLGFIQDFPNKIPVTQYPLIVFLLQDLSSHGKHPGPAALAPDQPAAGQYRISSLPSPLLHESSVGLPRFSRCLAELKQYLLGVHPRAFSLVHQGTVTTPRIAVQIFQGIYHSGPHGVEMDVANQGQKVLVLIAEDGFVAVFEEMAGAAVTTIKIEGVPGEKFAHGSGNARLTALENEVDVVVHQDPGVNNALPLRDNSAESFEESDFILVISKNVRLINAPNHDVMQGAGDIQSCLAWHDAILRKALGIVN